MKFTNLFLSVTVLLGLYSCNNKVANDKATAVKSNNPTAYNPLAPKVVDQFEKKFGAHEGKRRNHIDGFCFSGTLTLKDEEIQKYSSSKIFSKRPLKVNGRFSHKGGVKKNEGEPGDYGMAFEVHLEDGSIQNFSMIH